MTEDEIRKEISDMVEDGTLEMVGVSEDGEPMLQLRETNVVEPDDQITTAYIGAMNWIAGLDRRALIEDGYTEDQIQTGLRIGRLFEEHEYDTLRILSLWAGYIEASLAEGTEPDTEDFILATHIVFDTWKEE